jgi:hypothetical protein
MKTLKLVIVVLLFSSTFIKAQNNVRMTSYYDTNDKKGYYMAWDIKQENQYNTIGIVATVSGSHLK